MNIRYLRHNQIDKQQWDTTLEQCQNGLIYAQSRYLDVVSPKWEALVSDGYEYIMPLPVKKKYGIHYLIQPFFTQQLGVFSTHKINEQIIGQFLKKIPYISYALNFNTDNFHPRFVPLPNYLLSLHSPFESIKRHFSKNTQRNIQKAEKKSLYLLQEIDIERFINFYILYKKIRTRNNEIDEDIIRKLFATNFVHFMGIENNQHQLVAVLAYLYHNGRLVYWLPTSNEEGKKSSAMFLLISRLIEQYAGTNTVLDFEGSKIEGIARFYKGFGGVEAPYYTVRKNKPQWLSKWI